MSNLQGRLTALSPEQRELLEKRMMERGLESLMAIEEEQAASKKEHDTNAPTFIPKQKRTDAGIDLSLFFFSGDGSIEGPDKYKLLLESATFADQNGFAAVWTPERHFEDFGGLYPNPSVLSAALAMTTERLELRAGSVVLPLHHPIRFAEEWSVVDNLSGGRVSVAFATGWHPADFLLASNQIPEYYANRKQEMLQNIELVQRLWNGEEVPFTDANGVVHTVRTLPRPLRQPLDIWIATNGNPDTFREAAKIGANILTGITGAKFAEMEANIDMYRQTLKQYGFDPHSKKVALMLHTCLGQSDAEVKAKVKEPLQAYLKTFIRQQRNLISEYSDLSAADFDSIVSRAFELYFDESALLGTPDKCEKLIRTYRDIGIGDIACLIDFGLDHETVMNSLTLLAELNRQFSLERERVYV